MFSDLSYDSIYLNNLKVKSEVRCHYFFFQIKFMERRVGRVLMGPDDINITFPLAADLDTRMTLLGAVLFMRYSKT